MKKIYLLLAFLLVQIQGFANEMETSDFVLSTKSALVTPTFLPVGFVCINDAPSAIPVLPTVSQNGIAGSWNPSVISNAVLGTTNYTFTPNVGQNAVPVSVAVTVVASSSLTLQHPELLLDQQSVTINDSIIPIVYHAINASLFHVTGLPQGVVWQFEADSLKIVGAPLELGTFNYEIDVLDGCNNGLPIFGSLVSLPPPPQILLTSFPGSDFQIVCINTPIMPISYFINGADQVFVDGLPPGIALANNGTDVTFTGVPFIPGSYLYTVYAQNSSGVSSITGIVTVMPEPTLLRLSPPSGQPVCMNVPMTPIEYIVGNGATGATATGLPSGLASFYNASTGILSIVGVPGMPGSFNYLVETVGGCGLTTLFENIDISPSVQLNLQCGVNTGNGVSFDWQAVPGATSYNYSYTIGSGPAVSGTVTGVSNFTIPVAVGNQSVDFTITSVNGNVLCFEPETVTCLVLANVQFDEAAFEYYPNPVTDVLNLKYKERLSHIIIYNALGQQVLSDGIDANETTIDLSRFQSGMYFAKVETATGSKVIRLLKK